MHACTYISARVRAGCCALGHSLLSNFTGLTQKGSQRTGHNHLLFIKLGTGRPELCPCQHLLFIRFGTGRSELCGMSESPLYQVRNWSVRGLSLSASALYQVRNWSVRTLSLPDRQLFYLFILFIFKLHSRLWEIRVALPGYGTYNCRKSNATTPLDVCSIFVCPNNGMAASVWDFSLTCPQMLIHVIVHGGLYGYRKSLHWKLTLGRRKKKKKGKRKKERKKKNPLPHLGFEPESVLRLGFPSKALPTELSPPLSKTTEHLLCKQRRPRPLHGNNPRGQF